MPLVKRFEDLRIWQEARLLAKLVYEDFRECKDWSFRDQVQRAAVSVMNNLAEGFDRISVATSNHLFDVAKGSAGEVRSMYYLACDLSYVDKATAEERQERAYNIACGIVKYIQHNKNKK